MCLCISRPSRAMATAASRRVSRSSSPSSSRPRAHRPSTSSSSDALEGMGTLRWGPLQRSFLLGATPQAEELYDVHPAVARGIRSRHPQEPDLELLGQPAGPHLLPPRGELYLWLHGAVTLRQPPDRLGGSHRPHPRHPERGLLPPAVVRGAPLRAVGAAKALRPEDQCDGARSVPVRRADLPAVAQRSGGGVVRHPGRQPRHGDAERRAGRPGLEPDARQGYPRGATRVLLWTEQRRRRDAGSSGSGPLTPRAGGLRLPDLLWHLLPPLLCVAGAVVGGCGATPTFAGTWWPAP